MNFKTLHNQALSFILMILIVIACFPTSVIAFGKNLSNVSTEINASIIDDPIIIDPTISKGKIESVSLEQLKNNAPDAKTISELREMSVDISTLPVFIKADNAIKKVM